MICDLYVLVNEGTNDLELRCYVMRASKEADDEEKKEETDAEVNELQELAPLKMLVTRHWTAFLWESFSAEDEKLQARLSQLQEDIKKIMTEHPEMQGPASERKSVKQVKDHNGEDTVLKQRRNKDKNMDTKQ